MPVHDWSKMRPGDFHDFHQGWIVALRSRLNQFVLPAEYYCRVERAQTPIEIEDHSENDVLDSRKNQIAVYVAASSSLVGIVRFVPSSCKHDAAQWKMILDQFDTYLQAGIHLLIVDLFPTSQYDPQGIHGAISARLGEDSYRLPFENALTQVAYRAGEVLHTYVETTEVGGELSDMPLFLSTERYVVAPLVETYATALSGIAEPVRRALQQTLSH